MLPVAESLTPTWETWDESEAPSMIDVFGEFMKNNLSLMFIIALITSQRPHFQTETLKP